MGDLISRKAVIDLMRKLLGNTEYDGDKIIEVKDDIEKLPTAYDVNKVIEQLESNGIKMSESKIPHNYYKAISIKKAIEIVKGGGVNE